MRQYRLRPGSEPDAHRPRDVAGAWTRAFERVEPEQRLRAVLSLAGPLAGAQRAIVFGDDGIIAGMPGLSDGLAGRRLFARARRVLEDELVTPELYVARIAPDRPERLALRWRAAGDGSLDVARAIVASCGWALVPRAERNAPAGLPDGVATLQRLEQLVHDARRMRRSFAVIFVDVETTAWPADDPARDAVARSLRREVRANDHVGHLGGDSFLALLALESGEAEAYPAAQRLLRAVATADAWANVGVAICPDDGVQADELLEKANAAALAAASVGGAQPYWYREPTGRTLRERALLRARLSDGDLATLCEVRYQPIFDGRTGALCAASALLGWREPSAAAAPLDYFDGGPDRAAREALERWTVAAAAEAHRVWRAAGLDVRLHLMVATPSEALVEAVVAAFGTDDAMRSVWIELAGDPLTAPAALELFARRVRALGARVGLAAGLVATPPFDAAGELIDFVTVDDGGDVRTLAGLALASVIAPIVIARGPGDRERATWLVRHGATAVRAEQLAAPMGLHELVRWASDHSGSVAL